MLPGKTPLQASEMLENGALMVDVRERSEIAQVGYGGVAELLVFPLSEAQARLDELPRDREIIWACRSGNRSRQIGEALRAQGLNRGYNLEGGIIEWARQGLPVIEGGQ